MRFNSMLSESLMHEIWVQPGRVGRAGTAVSAGVKDPSVARCGLTSGLGGIDEHPGLDPDVHKGLQPGKRVIGTRSLWANDSARIPRSGEHDPPVMNG